MDRFERPAWWAYLLGVGAFALVFGEGLITGEITQSLVDRACWAMLLSGLSGLVLGGMMRKALADPLAAPIAPYAAAPATQPPAEGGAPSQPADAA